jgi:hypothetical protein
MSTIAEAISRVRNVIKSVKEDAFITDRFIYQLIWKYAKTLIKRESMMNEIFKYTSLFSEIPCVELIEVDKVEACCIGIKTNCTIKRTKEKLPKFLETTMGPVIREVSSLDYSVSLIRTYPTVYTNMTKTSSFKYNKNKYYWYLDGYIYVPDVEWEAIRLQAIFEDSTEALNCSDQSDECRSEQDRTLAIPEHMFSEIEQFVLREILTAGQIPSDGADDGQNIMR